MPDMQVNPSLEKPTNPLQGQEELPAAELLANNPGAQPPEAPRNRFHAGAHAAKRVIQGAVLTAEVLPVTNEGSRYGALFASELISHNPVLGAAVLGGSTLIVEGAGALAACEIITSPTSNWAIKWLNRRLERYVSPDAKMSPGVEAGIAMIAGTPVLMAAKQRQDPSRTTEEARKQGLLTAAWMAGVFAVEGALISEGVVQAQSLPEKLGAGVLITVGLAALPSWAKKAVGHWKTEESPEERFGEVRGTLNGATLTPEQVGSSAAYYEAFRDSEDEAVKIGLYGEDLEAAYNNPHAVLLEYRAKKGKGETVYAPLLVPAQELVWYNMDLLKRTYGYGKEFYYYAHPPVPQDAASQAIIADAIKEKLDRGSILFTDQYASQPEGVLDGIVSGGDKHYTMENLGGGDQQRTGEVFEAAVTFDGVSDVKEAPSLFEVYRECLEAGEISEDPQNGVSLAETIEGPDAEKIWQIYKDPFDRLGQDHPMDAGFDEETLLGILADPNVAKIVNRVDGNITTLCLFVQDFDHCPWFNKQYYKERYPEYYDTNNIAIFPGIVTDDAVRGESFSLPVISLATKLYAKRGSNMLITFECTEISAAYIPGIVSFAINHSEAGKVEKIGEPISVTEYKALRRIG